MTGDEDLTNVLKEQEEFNTSLRSTAHLHLFVLPKAPSSPPKATSEVILGASIKIIFFKNNGKYTNDKATKYNKVPSRRYKKKRNNTKLTSKKLDISKKTIRVTNESEKKFTFLPLSPRSSKQRKGSLSLEIMFAK